LIIIIVAVAADINSNTTTTSVSANSVIALVASAITLGGSIVTSDVSSGTAAAAAATTTTSSGTTSSSTTTSGSASDLTLISTALHILDIVENSYINVTNISNQTIATVNIPIGAVPSYSSNDTTYTLSVDRVVTIPSLYPNQKSCFLYGRLDNFTR